MEMGTHDPARNLPEGWVTLPGGGIVPAKLNRETGWGEDRDSRNMSDIAEARKAMNDATLAYAAACAKLYTEEANMVADLIIAIGKADAMVEAWHRFAEATGGADA